MDGLVAVRGDARDGGRAPEQSCELSAPVRTAAGVAAHVEHEQRGFTQRLLASADGVDKYRQRDFCSGALRCGKAAGGNPAATGEIAERNRRAPAGGGARHEIGELVGLRSPFEGDVAFCAGIADAAARRPLDPGVAVIVEHAPAVPFPLGDEVPAAAPGGHQLGEQGFGVSAIAAEDAVPDRHAGSGFGMADDERAVAIGGDEAGPLALHVEGIVEADVHMAIVEARHHLAHREHVAARRAHAAGALQRTGECRIEARREAGIELVVRARMVGSLLGMPGTGIGFEGLPPIALGCHGRHGEDSDKSEQTQHRSRFIVSRAVVQW
ncbi:hypothetical protein GCM10007973_20320 [Polymorphobacter multimanifer]|nr:hypothetical protein GCM10007973_20320 [Polymorphobacter multimanifer]